MAFDEQKFQEKLGRCERLLGRPLTAQEIKQLRRPYEQELQEHANPTDTDTSDAAD